MRISSSYPLKSSKVSIPSTTFWRMPRKFRTKAWCSRVTVFILASPMALTIGSFIWRSVGKCPTTPVNYYWKPRRCKNIISSSMTQFSNMRLPAKTISVPSGTNGIRKSPVAKPDCGTAEPGITPAIQNGRDSRISLIRWFLP